MIATIQSGIPVARIELLDEVQVRASNAHSKLCGKETPTMLLEFQGTEAFRLFTGISPDPDVFFATFASLGG